MIVRENLEDPYLGLEGPLGATRAGCALQQDPARAARYPVNAELRDQSDHRKATRGSIARFACELAMKRKRAGGKGKITCTSKYNMLREADELFRSICEETAKSYPEMQVREVYRR